MVAAATVLQIAGNFGHGRSREVGEKKEEREGIRFHALPAAEMHRRDRILRRKMKGGSVLSCAGSCSGDCLLHTWGLGGGLRLQEREGARAALEGRSSRGGGASVSLWSRA
jgi:hypothetical protein